MAGNLTSTADRIRRRKRSNADALEAAIEARLQARRSRAKPKAAAKPKKRQMKRRAPTRAQKVRSVSVDNSAALADVERRMKEIMASSSTPDKR